MKTLLDESGAAKDVAKRFAALKTKHKKAADPATAALASIGSAIAAAGSGDRLHVVVAVAEVPSEPRYKVDVSITAAAEEN